MTSAGGAETPAGGYSAGDGLCLSQVEFLPELRLYLFDASVGLFDPAGGEYRSDRPPPFWGFAWAGGQAVARYVLDHAETVRGRRVLDLACGSGLVAVAAAISVLLSKTVAGATASAAPGWNASRMRTPRSSWNDVPSPRTIRSPS